MNTCNCYFKGDYKYDPKDVKIKDYNSDNIYTWCTNCGNYGIHTAIKRALVNLNISPKDAVLCFDIGCNGNGSDKILGYRFHGLHGRVIPLATGVALSNSRLTVIASGGDGATFNEGLSHLVHAIRSNYNITFLLHNNQNFALTKGQGSSLTPSNLEMGLSPYGVIESQIHVMDFVLNLNPSFVARGFSGNVKQLTHIIEEGVNHKGFSFIEIMQDCPTYNKHTPHNWFMERLYDVNEIENYDTSNLETAKEVSKDTHEKIATGILYKDNTRTDFLSSLTTRKDRETELIHEVDKFDISNLLEHFRK